MKIANYIFGKNFNLPKQIRLLCCVKEDGSFECTRNSAQCK